MLLPITNHRMILGDFNESLTAKLAIVLEEAALQVTSQPSTR